MVYVTLVLDLTLEFDELLRELSETRLASGRALAHRAHLALERLVLVPIRAHEAVPAVVGIEAAATAIIVIVVVVVCLALWLVLLVVLANAGPRSFCSTS